MLLWRRTSDGTGSTTWRWRHGHHATRSFASSLLGRPALNRCRDHMPLRRLVFEPARETLVWIERARDHGQALVEEPLQRRLEEPLLLDLLLEFRAPDLFGVPAHVLEQRVEEIRPLRVGADRVQRLGALHAEVLETRAELLHLEGVRLDPLLALADEREHDGRDGGLGARRWDESLGRPLLSVTLSVAWGRSAVTGRRSAVTRRGSITRRWGGLSVTGRARRAGRESIHGSKIRQSDGSRNRELLSFAIVVRRLFHRVEFSRRIPEFRMTREPLGRLEPRDDSRLGRRPVAQVTRDVGSSTFWATSRRESCTRVAARRIIAVGHPPSLRTASPVSNSARSWKHAEEKRRLPVVGIDPAEARLAHVQVEVSPRGHARTTLAAVRKIAELGFKNWQRHDASQLPLAIESCNTILTAPRRQAGRRPKK
jgi:hypothetical protein